jgi:hypothetical protein
MPPEIRASSSFRCEKQRRGFASAKSLGSGTGELHIGLKAGTSWIRNISPLRTRVDEATLDTQGFWPFAGKSDIRPAARSAESRDFVGPEAKLQFAGLAQR